jgi:hypothetical protein
MAKDRFVKGLAKVVTRFTGNNIARGQRGVKSVPMRTKLRAPKGVMSGVSPRGLPLMRASKKKFRSVY